MNGQAMTGWRQLVAQPSQRAVESADLPCLWYTAIMTA